MSLSIERWLFRSPAVEGETHEVIEVGVTRNQRQAVLDGNGSDPDVVFWERTAETTQRSLYLTIHARLPDHRKRHSLSR